MRGHEVASAFQKQAADLGNVLSEQTELRAEIGGKLGELDQQLAQARRELAAVYLTSLDDAAIERAQKLTGFQGFARRDPRVAMAQERKAISARLPQLENDPRYARRDVLVGPDGTLTQERDQAMEALAPLQTECDRFESLPGFLELVQVGYDTPNFTEHWWQATYWKHWAAGDRICKALGLADFGDDVLPAYKKYRDPRDVLRADVDRIDREIAAVHALVQERDQLADRLTRLPEIYLAEAQQFLGEHLEHADPALLEQWVAGDAELERAVRVGVRKLAGITAKKGFLTEIRDQGLAPSISALDDRRKKANQKRAKFSRPKHAYASFGTNVVDPKFDERTAALRAQNQKLRRRIDALMLADNYYDFDLRNDPSLWWLHLMGGPPPRWAPHTYGYYQANPTLVPLVDPDYADWTGPGHHHHHDHDRGDDADPTATAAAAFVNRDVERDGYMS